jgi:hypothetical protein
MKPINLRVPRKEAPDLADDLTAWANDSGVDPRPTIVGEPGATTNTSSPIRYQVYVSKSFFEQFPEWLMYIEQWRVTARVAIRTAALRLIRAPACQSRPTGDYCRQNRNGHRHQAQFGRGCVETPFLPLRAKLPVGSI